MAQYITVENGELVVKDGEVYPIALRPMVQAVMDHALENYSIGEAWDHVIECWAEAEVADAVQHCKSPDEAIARMRDLLSPIADREAEMANV